MKLMNSLARSHLLKNKRQTLSAFLAITLSVSMLVAISTFCFSVYESAAAFAKAHDLMDTMSSSLSGLILVGAVMGSVIVVAAVFVIANAFNIQASERARQFGILKSVGATDAQIRSTITAESNWLSLVSIPAGIVLGHLICFAALLLLQSSTGGDSSSGATTMEYTVHFNLVAILLAAGLGYVSVYFASSLTANKVSRLSAIEAIRQTDEIKIDSKNLKTSGAIGKLFGFEGTLAAKQLKRHKRKFRATVLSLVVSIVLLLGGFSFGDTLIKTARGAYANTGANVVSQVTGSSSDFAKFADYEKMLAAHNPQSMHTLYDFLYASHDYPSDTSGIWWKIITLNDADYQAYCQQAGLTPGSNIAIKREGNPQLPFEVTLPGLGNSSFLVTQESSVVNPYLNSLLFTTTTNIIIPQSEAERLNIPLTAHYFINAENAITFIADIKAESAGFGFGEVSHHNTEEYTREMQRMFALLMAFVYCFIGMLALIGATSVLATINSNINLRKSEFATLQAVGMETRKLHKMLNLESLFYGIKSLVYGLPLGLLLSYAMHWMAVNDVTGLAVGRLSAEDAVKFPFEFPLVGVLICIVGVFVINFVSMHFATGKIRRSNIAETMRELTI